jgi:hypothetical protein
MFRHISIYYAFVTSTSYKEEFPTHSTLLDQTHVRCQNLTHKITLRDTVFKKHSDSTHSFKTTAMCNTSCFTAPYGFGRFFFRFVNNEIMVPEE